LRGKKIALIDDSIVRGDTLKTLVSTLRESGVSEIHVFVTFPKIIGPCFYGIDMATFQELAAFNRSDEEIRKFIGADSVNYQTIEDFVDCISSKNVCLGCLTLNYPTKYAMKLSRLAMNLALKGVKVKGRITEEFDGDVYG
jgi:amidophosphoribosyltransferase